MAIVLPALAALIALAIAPAAFFHFDVTPKVSLLVIGVGVLLLFSRDVLHGLNAIASREHGERFLWILGAQAAALYLAAAFSTHPILSVYGSTWRRSGVLTQTAVLAYAAVLAGWFAADRQNAITFLRWTVVAGIATACYGTLQYFGVDPLLPAAAYHVGEGEWTIVRPPSTLGHASYFATFQLYAMFGAAALRGIEKSRRWRWAAAAGVTAGAAAVVLTGTRSAMLGTAIGAAMLAFETRRKLNWKHAALATAVVAAGAGFYFSPAGQKLRGRARWYVEDPTGGGRPLLWRDTLGMVKGRWLTGYGPETFGPAFPRFQSLALARLHPDFYQESPHNVFLDALAEEGVGGLAALGAVCWLVLRRRGPDAVRAGFAGGLVSQQFSCFTVPTTVYFYAMAALAVSQSPVRQERSLPSRLRVAAGAVGAALAVYGALLAAADLTMAQVRRDLERDRYAAAASKYKWVQRLQSRRVSADLYLSRTMLQVSQRLHDPGQKFEAWQHAMAAAARAAAADEQRPNALVNLAAFQSMTNDARAVERTLWSAAEEAPNWYRPPWLLARLYLLLGRREEAERMAVAAVDRNGGRNEEVRKTLDEARNLQR
jgi:O-antigen ligase